MIDVKSSRFFGKLVAGLLSSLLLSSCGASFFPSSTTIVSIALSPTSAQVLANGTQQFTATGRYGNNSTGDVTSQVTWTSSATSVATINTSGLATGVALGTTTIQATSGSVIATASLIVSSKTLVSVTVSPASLSLISGQNKQYSATANYSDGTNSDVTNSATWSSSNQGLATITSTGFATAISSGIATISAVYGGKTGTATLTVL